MITKKIIDKIFFWRKPKTFAQMWPELQKMDKLKWLRHMAVRHGWHQIAFQGDIKMISFMRDEARINVYYSTMTVATCLKHPKKGKTQLFRRGVKPSQMFRIFENPRCHTQKGYYERRELQKNHFPRVSGGQRTKSSR